MTNENVEQTVFLTLIRTRKQRRRARLLVESIRSFGGAMRHCPIWLFETNVQNTPCDDFAAMGAQVLPLDVPDTVRRYWYAAKVHACAQAEARVAATTRSLIWLSPDSLIIKPPHLFDLAPSFDVAVRPVHIKNVGLLATEPLDDFWRQISNTVRVPETRQPTVESFVDAQHIRAYFNTHAVAVDPAKGLFQRWFVFFERLVGDDRFQSTACQDVPHQVFLHAAVLSAVIVSQVDPEKIRTLPPDYSYPYNLHQSVPEDRRPPALDDLVSIAYEDRSLDPNIVDDITIGDPLRSWLLARVGAARQ